MNQEILDNFKRQMAIKLDTTTNNEAEVISNMVDGALSGKGGNDPELESLKKQMVIKLGATTNEDAQIISNMVDNAAGGGGGKAFTNPTLHIKFVAQDDPSDYLRLFDAIQTVYVAEEHTLYTQHLSLMDVFQPDEYSAFIISPDEDNPSVFTAYIFASNSKRYHNAIIYNKNSGGASIQHYDVTELDNCTYNNDYAAFIITDPTKDAYCTLVYNPE